MEDDDRNWPPCLGLYPSVVIALTYLRTLLGKVLRYFVPTADELDPHEQYIVDGTLLPCWSWAGHPELYSGKHRSTGMSVQVALHAVRQS